MYGNDPLKNFVGLVDIENHYSEDKLKSIRFRERASVVHKFPNLYGTIMLKKHERLTKMNF